MRRTLRALYGPRVYLAGQRAAGFHQARSWCLQELVRAQAGQRLLDVGCGPTLLPPHLHGVDYVGFDTDARAIAWSRRRYPAARFESGLLTRESARDLGTFHHALLFGVLHHLDDVMARDLLALLRDLLVPGGQVVTLDGAYVPGQSRVARRLLDRDVGEHVRSPDGYQTLVDTGWASATYQLHEELSWVPYTFFFMQLRKVDGDGPDGDES